MAVTSRLAEAGVAAAALLPMMHTTLGTWAPHAPAGYVITGVALVTVAELLPERPIDAVS